MEKGLEENPKLRPKTLVVEWILRIFLGGVFIYAALTKIGHTREFGEIITHYQILPEHWTLPIAIWLPWVELTAGLGILSGWWKLGAATVITTLLFIFTAALSLSLIRGIDINCGCFSTGSTAHLPILVDLLRDIVFTAMGVALLFRLAVKTA
jgi:putative oxidoreductase